MGVPDQGLELNVMLCSWWDESDSLLLWGRACFVGVDRLNHPPLWNRHLISELFSVSLCLCFSPYITPSGCLLFIANLLKTCGYSGIWNKEHLGIVIQLPLLQRSWPPSEVAGKQSTGYCAAEVAGHFQLVSNCLIAVTLFQLIVLLYSFKIQYPCCSFLVFQTTVSYFIPSQPQLHIHSVLGRMQCTQRLSSSTHNTLPTVWCTSLVANFDSIQFNSNELYWHEMQQNKYMKCVSLSLALFLSLWSVDLVTVWNDRTTSFITKGMTLMLSRIYKASLLRRWEFDYFISECDL